MLQFVAGTEKGGVAQGDLINDPFRLGAMSDARVNYTGAAVVEAHEVAEAEATEKYVEVRAMWTPVLKVAKVTYDGVEKTIITTGTPAAGEVLVEISPSDGASIGFTFGDTIVAEKEVKFAYAYDNIVVPQESDLPILNAKMTSIALEAKARRIAIYYSQMAAFQAKTETGTDLGEVLATQACAELSYEIDTEVVDLLNANAVEFADLTWNKRLPVGVSKPEHYEGFAEIVELASQHIYDKTQKHAANYMVIASNIKPILSLMRGWKAASTGKINGPYFAGTLNGVKVFVSPRLVPGRYFLGFNGDDLITSAAVYAPYMAVVPTQLLGFSDGSLSQGFSTLYDLKMLNKDLLVAGKVVNDDFVSGVVKNTL